MNQSREKYVLAADKYINRERILYIKDHLLLRHILGIPLDPNNTSLQNRLDIQMDNKDTIIVSGIHADLVRHQLQLLMAEPMEVRETRCSDEEQRFLNLYKFYGLEQATNSETLVLKG